MKIQQITGVFGARITGIDLAQQHSDATIGEISAALKKYKVLVFPDQQSLTPEKHLAFGKRFGTVETTHPTWPSYPGSPGVLMLTMDGTEKKIGQRHEGWHTDGSTRENTAWISLLQAIEVPPYGRDTLFADMEAVFAGLSPTMQNFLEGLTALHSWGKQKPDAPPVEHPVVLKDASTGRKWLYVNSTYTRSIVGLTERESDTLLQFLYEQIHVAEFQLRVSWQPRALVMWDNESTQHYIIYDTVFPRVMHRVMASPA